MFGRLIENIVLSSLHFSYTLIFCFQADSVLLRQRKAVFLPRNVRRKKQSQPDVESEIKGIGPVAVPAPVSEGNDQAQGEKSAADRKKKEKSRYVSVFNCSSPMVLGLNHRFHSSAINSYEK